MLLSTANQLYIRRILRTRATKILLLLFFLVNLFDALRIHSHITHVELSKPPPRPRPKGERFYIASMHFNDGLLLEQYWNDALLSLVNALGKENVWVSIYESGSWDHTKYVLQTLDYELWNKSIPRRIELGEETHWSEMESEDPGEGWIKTPRGKREPRRIPFLSRLRNKTLKDLLDHQALGLSYDKIIFLNDVVFTVSFLQLSCFSIPT